MLQTLVADRGYDLEFRVLQCGVTRAALGQMLAEGPLVNRLVALQADLCYVIEPGWPGRDCAGSDSVRLGPGTDHEQVRQ